MILSLLKTLGGEGWRRMRISCLCCLAFGLIGCSTIFNPFGAPSLRDARVESLEAVEEFALMPNGLRRFPPLILVTFSTDRDLATYRQVYAVSLYLDAALCRSDDEPDPARLVSHSEVLTAAGNAVDSYLTTAMANPARQDGRYSYRFYLDARSQPAQFPPERIRVAHDFRRDNDDICFAFSGGSILALSHRSPGFRIPYALIADALARAGMPHAAPRAPLTSGS